MTVLETNAPSEEERESGATQGAAATQQTSSNITSASCGGDGNGRDNKRISTTSESMVAKPEKPYVGCSDDGLNNLNNGRSRQPNNSSIRSERINGNETSERLKSILYERPGSASNITEMIEKTLLPESPKQGIAVAAAMGGGTGTGGGGRTAFPPGRVSIRDMNYGIPSVAVIGDHVEEVHGESSWRAKVIHFVHQRWLQRVMLALLCLDVIIIFTELFLLSLYPSCDLVVRDCISCCPYDGEAGAHSDPSHSAIRWLAGDDNKHEALCEPGYDEYRGHPSCDSHKWHGVHTTEEVLFWGTITILSLFFLENLSEMMALTPCTYFKVRILYCESCCENKMTVIVGVWCDQQYLTTRFLLSSTYCSS
jgi:hypothetical protein